jgi:hypothetical protein
MNLFQLSATDSLPAILGMGGGQWEGSADSGGVHGRPALMWIEKLTEIQRERCLLAVRAFFCALLLISVFVCVYLCASLPLIACCV